MKRRNFLKALAVTPVAAAAATGAMAMGPQKFQHRGILHSTEFTHEELVEKPEWCEEQIRQMSRAFNEELNSWKMMGKIRWKKFPIVAKTTDWDSMVDTYTWSAQFHVI